MSLLPCGGVFCIWQFFVVCFLLSPVILYRGSLEGSLLGGPFGLDEWSGCLVMLSFWLGALMAWSLAPSVSLCVWGVVVSSVMAFCSWNFISFYVFFELSLVPVVILILERGVQPERLSAVFYMVLYTLSGSLPFLALVSFQQSTSCSFSMVRSVDVLGSMGWWGLALVAAFLIKLPCYPFHLWLAKAHVEAPTVGSMALAGLLLKLGGVGLMRCLLVFGGLKVEVASFLVSVSFWGGLMCSIICFRLLDAKSLIAYSSVGHMALVLVGVLSGSSLAWKGAVVMMVAHGLSSSGLFSLLGEMYGFTGSRSLLVVKGMMGFVPGLMVWWFVMCVSCMACPPSVNFVAEVSLGGGVLSVWPMLMVVFGLSAIFVGIYSLVLYSSVAHGVESSLRPKCFCGLKGGYMGAFHGVPLFFLFLFPGVF